MDTIDYYEYILEGQEMTECTCNHAFCLEPNYELNLFEKDVVGGGTQKSKELCVIDSFQATATGNRYCANPRRVPLKA